jgi:hypothetical protein
LARKVFYSFHFKPDNWRTAQVRNFGSLEGNPVLSDNDWEQVKAGGPAAIQKWIDEQMKGRPCVIVLIGAETAGRPWIRYEIEKAWIDGRGLCGIHIHKLLDQNGIPSAEGRNPFSGVKIGELDLGTVVPVHNPPQNRSTDVYQYIGDNLAVWAEHAIWIRGH